MRIAIVVNGSRGDVQPMVALAQKLQEHGHEAWPWPPWPPWPPWAPWAPWPPWAPWAPWAHGSNWEHGNAMGM